MRLILLLIAYGIVTGVAYHFQVLASSKAPYVPSTPYWIAIALLFIFTFRHARGTFIPASHWQQSDEGSRFPFTWKWSLFLVLWGLLLFLLQAGYMGTKVQPGALPWFVLVTGIPWYVPMIGWALGIYFLFRAQFPGWSDFSHWLKGEFISQIHRPFTYSTGSVSELEGEDAGVACEEYYRSQIRIPRHWHYYGFGILLILAAALYTVGATAIPTDVHGDEGEVALQAFQIRRGGDWNFFQFGWYQIPYFFYVVPAVVTWFFGDNLFGMRMTGALVGIASVGGFYFLARRMFTPFAALLATFLFVVSTYFIHFSRIGIGYNQTTLITILALYFFIRGLQDADSRNFSFAGFLAGMGYISYQATHLLLPMLLLSFILLWVVRYIGFRQMLNYSFTYLFALLITLSPLLGSFSIVPLASYSRAKSVSILSDEGWNYLKVHFPENATNLEIFTIQMKGAFMGPITHPDHSPYLVNPEHGGVLDPATTIMFLAGLMLLFSLLRRNPVSLLLLFWILLTIITSSVLTAPSPYYQRLVGLIPLLILVAAPIFHGALQHWSEFGRWSSGKVASVAVALALLLFVLMFNRYFHGIQSRPQMLDEWTRIARYLAEQPPTHYTYFLGVPHVYFDYGTIKFLAPNALGENVLVPERFLSRKVYRKGPVTFLLVRSNTQYIHTLRTMYPGGIEQSWVNSQGGGAFITYTVFL